MIKINLAIACIDWISGEFFVLVDEENSLPFKKVESLEHQPIKLASELGKTIVDLSENWMKYKIQDVFMLDDIMNICYGTVVPYDTKISEGYNWINIKFFNSNNENIKSFVEESVKGMIW